VPALNLAKCWKLWNVYFTQSTGNLLSLYLLGIFRDYTPEFICFVLSVSYCILSDPARKEFYIMDMV
jgi:hypothetical protein